MTHKRIVVKAGRFTQALEELRDAAERKNRTLDEERARQDIDAAVWSCEQEMKRKGSRLTPAHRRTHYKALLETVEAARLGYEELLNRSELIDPMVWAWGDPDWAHVEGHVREILRNLRVQERWLELAEREADSTVAPKGGRTKGSKIAGLTILVCMLADAWGRQTQDNVGYSRPPNGGTPCGPFVRFAEAVVEEAGLAKLSKNLPEYVAAVVNTRDEDLARARRLSPIEMFGAELE